MSVIVILLVFAGICTAYGLLLQKFGLKGLKCSRSFSRPAVFEGEEAELVEVISNDRPMLVPWLRLESRISQNLQFNRQQNPDANG